MPVVSAADKWDRRFAGHQAPGKAAAVVRDNLHLLPVCGHAADIACGLGGNAVALAHAGLAVEALDLSAVALNRLAQYATRHDLAITTHHRDLESDGLQTGQLDVIVCTYYLYRPLCQKLSAALRPGGLLFYQTFTRNRIGNTGPDNPDFRLVPNELLRLFAGLDIVLYREEADLGDTGRGLRNEACLIARRPRTRSGP